VRGLRNFLLRKLVVAEEVLVLVLVPLLEVDIPILLLLLLALLQINTVIEQPLASVV
jgi:hypothetical protein